MAVKRNQDLTTLNVCAQKLNNRAAELMDAGLYRAAIPMLVKALRITEAVGCGTQESSKCYYCSLDYCVTYSRSSSSQKCHSKAHHDSSDEKATSFERASTSCSSDDNDNADETDQGYVYSHLIRIPPQCILQRYTMGMTLPLIATFNLALAHHLLTLRDRSSGRKKVVRLQKVLKLYELTYRWQMKGRDPQADSIRFSMIIANNLAELHRASENFVKQKICLQHLLSTLMFVMNSSHYQLQGNDRIGTNMGEFEGFFRNTSQLIVQDQCAGAA